MLPGGHKTWSGRASAAEVTKEGCFRDEQIWARTGRSVVCVWEVTFAEGLGLCVAAWSRGE